MTSIHSKIFYNGELCGEENLLPEMSYESPSPSTQDSCVTETLTCETHEPTVLEGKFSPSTDSAELTLALIKPDGMKFRLEIEKRMRDEGFEIVQTRMINLTPEVASNFYCDHIGRPYFPLLVWAMCEGPTQIYVLRRKDAIVKWKTICGPVSVDQAKLVWPESLRAIYGTSGETFRNICHGSPTMEKAKKDIRFFFPDMVIDENLKSQTEAEDYLKEFVNPTLLLGLTHVCKNKPLDPVLYLAHWLLFHNPYKPRTAEYIALAPT